MRSLLDFEVDLVARRTTNDILESLSARADRDDVLVDLVFDVSILLRRTLDFMAFLESASSESDPSYADRPAIRDHLQNHEMHSWTALIELARDGFESAARANPSFAEQLAAVWARTPYPVFRRLYLHAARILLR
jgi:hypothetical protein